MNSSDINRKRLQHRIDEYLTEQVRIALKGDFDIIEDLVHDYIQRYSLKQLIIMLRLEASKRKHSPLK